MNDPTKLGGGCLCGAIRYEVTGPIESIIQCHCSDCQKASGAGASANAAIASSDFTLTAGTPKVFSKTVDSGRTLRRAFCGDCGSPIWSMRANAPERMILKMGSLDDSSQARIVMNIWTRSARPWVAWDHDLPSHAQGRPA